MHAYACRPIGSSLHGTVIVGLCACKRGSLWKRFGRFRLDLSGKNQASFSCHNGKQGHRKVTSSRRTQLVSHAVKLLSNSLYWDRQAPRRAVSCGTAFLVWFSHTTHGFNPRLCMIDNDCLLNFCTYLRHMLFRMNLSTLVLGELWIQRWVTIAWLQPVRLPDPSG